MPITSSTAEEQGEDLCKIPKASEIRSDSDANSLIESHSWTLVYAKDYAVESGILISLVCSRCKAKTVTIVAKGD